MAAKSWSYVVHSNFSEGVGEFVISLNVKLLQGGRYLVQAPRWKLVNYRRQTAAAWGFAARVPPAQPHPLPNVGALPMPFTITLKPNWPQFVVALGCWSAQ
jgi:hypothetical protein